MNVQRGEDSLSRASANGIGRAFFPAVKSDVDLEQNHDDEQDGAAPPEADVEDMLDAYDNTTGG